MSIAFGFNFDFLYWKMNIFTKYKNSFTLSQQPTALIIEFKCFISTIFLVIGDEKETGNIGSMLNIYSISIYGIICLFCYLNRGRKKWLLLREADNIQFHLNCSMWKKSKIIFLQIQFLWVRCTVSTIVQSCNN